MSELRMRAYYYDFEPTGDRAIDLILSAVATTGKVFHHTEHWNDSDAVKIHPPFRGETLVDAIQNAAIDAAKAKAEAEATLQRVRELCVRNNCAYPAPHPQDERAQYWFEAGRENMKQQINGELDAILRPAPTTGETR